MTHTDSAGVASINPISFLLSFLGEKSEIGVPYSLACPKDLPYLQDHSLFGLPGLRGNHVRGGRPVYNPKIKDENYAVAKALNSVLRDLATHYTKVVDEETHIENIATLAKRVAGKCGGFLNEDRLVFGVAQKALNSYLKYLWCAGRIERPPHCPFDSIIIGKLKLPNDCGWKWTEANQADYRAWVSAAERAAKDESLAEWELREWNPIGRESDSRD